MRLYLNIIFYLLRFWVINAKLNANRVGIMLIIALRSNNLLMSGPHFAVTSFWGNDLDISVIVHQADIRLAFFVI